MKTNDSFLFLAGVLVFVGAINWGLVGLSTIFNTNLNVVDMVFGQWPYVENLIYVLVGCSAIYRLIKTGRIA